MKVLQSCEAAEARGNTSFLKLLRRRVGTFSGDCRVELDEMSLAYMFECIGKECVYCQSHYRITVSLDTRTTNT